MKNYKAYDQTSAEVEARGVTSNRLQNLVITLDKAKYFLRTQKDTVRAKIFIWVSKIVNQGPLLVLLTERELLQYLWTGKNSVIDQAMASLNEYYGRLRRNENAFIPGKRKNRDRK